jgi:hypothetical protein
MAVGTYGIKKLANVNLADIEVIYTYSPNRDSLPTGEPQTLNPQDVLNRVNDPIKGNGQLLDGWYNLRLPSDSFSSLGFYNIIIRPLTTITTINDCGSLAAFPDKKGIVIESNVVGDVNELVGSRIEYKDNNQYRVITSANRVEPVNQNLPNSTQKSVRYRFTDNSSLVFLTLTTS